MESVIDESTETKTQLFITTHSIEFLRRILPSIRQRTKDVRLLRTRRKDDGTSWIEQIAGDVMEAAVEQDVEFR